MEKFLVTQCGWLRLCTTISIGMTITNCWKLFCYGVKRNHFNKSISIRELSEKIAVDWFNNPFTTDTGTPAKNIPSPHDIDIEGTVSTFWSLKYPSSYPYNSEISTISDITIVTSPTTSIDHMDLKEVQFWGGRYNRVARGYCHRMLHNGKRCLKGILWYCHDC